MEGRTIAVVRRGDTDTFDLLRDLCRGTEVQVHWDRRHSDRRTGTAAAAPAERRRGERRQPPRTTWRTLGFVVVGCQEPTS
jgi:hypothetical protein